MSSQESRALVVALELLRAQLERNMLAITSNTQATEIDISNRARALQGFMRGGSRGGGPNAEPSEARGGSTSRALTMLGGRLTAILGPIALFAAALNAQISGLQVLTSSAKVLAASLAPVLLPVTTLLSAALLAISEIIFTKGMPVFEQFFAFVLSRGLPALAMFLDNVMAAADAVTSFAKNVGEAIAFIERIVSRIPGGKEVLSGALGPILGSQLGERGSSAAALGRGLTDTLRSLRLSMGPRAQITGLESVGKQVQLAALQQDPIEARILKINQDMLTMLERIAGNTMPGGSATPGNGAFTPPTTPVGKTLAPDPNRSTKDKIVRGAFLGPVGLYFAGTD